MDMLSFPVATLQHSLAAKIRSLQSRTAVLIPILKIQHVQCSLGGAVSEVKDQGRSKVGACRPPEAVS